MFSKKKKSGVEVTSSLQSTQSLVGQSNHATTNTYERSRSENVRIVSHQSVVTTITSTSTTRQNISSHSRSIFDQNASGPSLWSFPNKLSSDAVPIRRPAPSYRSITLGTNGSPTSRINLSALAPVNSSQTNHNFVPLTPSQPPVVSSASSTFRSAPEIVLSTPGQRPTTNVNNNNNVISEVPRYGTPGKRPTGKVLVINNRKFLTDENERKGSEFDEDSLDKLFSRTLNYSVESHKNLTKSQMMSKIKTFRNKSSLRTCDISVVVIMSHGSNTNDKGELVHGGYTEIIGTDGKGLLVDEVLEQFTAVNCKYLLGKPKIFIFQCCRGSTYEKISLDAVPITKPIKKQHADMLIAYSTLPGFFSLRNENTGSWYIQMICDVFKKEASRHDVESMLKIVDEKLNTLHPEYSQTSMYESRGFKRCYLTC